MLAYIQNHLPEEQTFKACQFMTQLGNSLGQMKFDMVPINTNISVNFRNRRSEIMIQIKQCYFELY